MSYEQTLLTVRALSEGKLQRDPNAPKLKPPEKQVQKPLVVFPDEPPKNTGEMIGIIREEICRHGNFTQPELAIRVAARTNRHNMDTIKSMCYDEIYRGVKNQTITIVDAGIRSKRHAVFRRKDMM